MAIKRILLVIVTMLLIAGLAACERPASQSPTDATEDTQKGDFPVPGVTDDVMGQLEGFATQTAMALEGGGTPMAGIQATPTGGAQPAVETTAQATAVPQVSQATAAPVVVPTATPGKPASWTLQKGEHPYCIARRFDVNPEQMLSLSGLARNDSYNPGTVLKIPTSGSFPANRTLRSHPTTYTVSSGDSIYSIACLFGDVDPYAIAAANSLAAPYKINSGQQLQVP